MNEDIHASDSARRAATESCTRRSGRGRQVVVTLETEPTEGLVVSIQYAQSEHDGVKLDFVMTGTELRLRPRADGRKFPTIIADLRPVLNAMADAAFEEEIK